MLKWTGVVGWLNAGGCGLWDHPGDRDGSPRALRELELLPVPVSRALTVGWLTPKQRSIYE